MEIKIGFAPKTVRLADNDYLHFWYANNRGRGSSNCTIVRSEYEDRAANADRQPGRRTFTSSWAGNVNFSKRVRQALGLN